MKIDLPEKHWCKTCGGRVGAIVVRSGQNTVWCEVCKSYTGWNAPKTATGEQTRSVKTTHEAITSKTRSLILERATRHCEICGAGGIMHVGHVLSVKDGLEAGLSDDLINSEENLACMCEQCNLGIGSRPLPIRLLVSILAARYKLNGDPSCE